MGQRIFCSRRGELGMGIRGVRGITDPTYLVPEDLLSTWTHPSPKMEQGMRFCQRGLPTLSCAVLWHLVPWATRAKWPPSQRAAVTNSLEPQLLPGNSMQLPHAAACGYLGGVFGSTGPHSFSHSAPFVAVQNRRVSSLLGSKNPLEINNLKYYSSSVILKCLQIIEKALRSTLWKQKAFP